MAGARGGGVYSQQRRRGLQRTWHDSVRFVVAGCFAGSLPLAAVGTPLIDAVKRHDRAAVNALLDRGADVDAAEADGTTALHWAAQLDDLATVDSLLDAGAAATAANRFDVTPLELAANNGNGEIVARLLAAGADRMRARAKAKRR